MIIRDAGGPSAAAYDVNWLDELIYPAGRFV
jgi:hypothetical protein